MPCVVAQHLRPWPSRPGHRDLAAGLRERLADHGTTPATRAATSSSTRTTASVRRPAAPPRPGPEPVGGVRGAVAGCRARRSLCRRAAGPGPVRRVTSGEVCETARRWDTWQSIPGVPACRGPRYEHPWRTRAHLPVRLHRVRSRVRAVPELQRRRADRVPAVRGSAAQGLQRRGRGVQGLRASTATTAAPTPRLLQPGRVERLLEGVGHGSSNGSSDTSSSVATKTETAASSSTATSTSSTAATSASTSAA